MCVRLAALPRPTDRTDDCIAAHAWLLRILCAGFARKHQKAKFF